MSGMHHRKRTSGIGLWYACNQSSLSCWFMWLLIKNPCYQMLWILCLNLWFLLWDASKNVACIYFFIFPFYLILNVHFLGFPWFLYNPFIFIYLSFFRNVHLFLFIWCMFVDILCMSNFFLDFQEAIPLLHRLNMWSWRKSCLAWTVWIRKSLCKCMVYIIYRLLVIHIYQLLPRNLKGGIGSLFDPCVNAMGRRPYWPSCMEVSYCTFGFGVICTHYCYRVIHRAITIKCAWFKSTRERQLTLAWQA